MRDILLCLTFSCLTSFAETNSIPLIIAHRGASEDAPENTLAAFRLAWEQGADGIEGDFFLSSDGKVVCIHDKNTKKISDGNLDVTKSTLMQLRQLDYGSWKNAKFKNEPIPTLEEVLDAIPANKWFFLEIKDSPRIVEPIAKILREKSANTSHTVLISFNAEVIKACRKQLPEYRACLLSSLKKFSKQGSAEKYLADVRASNAQGLFYKESPEIPKKWLEQARGEGGLLATWTVNQLEPAIRATQHGVDFLITDRPAGLRKELESAPRR
ncbi:MAG: glycerophosphodiester phosphodiesterase family protein [Akkermansiaceae bacterium]